MMLRILAAIFGVGFLVLGSIAFFSEFLDSGNLFGVFRFNFEYRIAHLFSGILGILCGLYGRNVSQIYLIAIGIIYGLLAAIGFSQPNGMILGMFDNNRADSWFNAAIAAISISSAFTRNLASSK